jgi:hypothetical protein
MPVRPASALRILSADVLAAAALTIATIAAASAATQTGAAPTAIAAVDRSDKGLPPTPGPTNPNEP